MSQDTQPYHYVLGKDIDGGWDSLFAGFDYEDAIYVFDATVYGIELGSSEFVAARVYTIPYNMPLEDLLEMINND